MLKKTLLPFIKPYFQFINRCKVIGKPKIFGIGLNKTGTTSLKFSMIELGFIVGEQRKAELLIEDWAKRDFKRIISYCKTAQFFQDLPFGLDYTYVALDQAFKGSKFILTVRDTPEQWYESLTRFHGNIWGKGGKTPDKEDLKKAVYIYKGRPWRVNRLIFDTPEENPYRREDLINYYVSYNEGVKRYFKYRPNDLLVLNVADNSAYSDLCTFLNMECEQKSFPWKNKTAANL